MANKTKIVDESEVIRWFNEGKTYQWMTDEYIRKYNIETNPSMWAAWRRRKGLDRRIARDDELIPWAVNEEHRWSYAVQMLRFEARVREGLPVGADQLARLDSWKAMLEEADAVVHYDPDTADGFHYIPREPVDGTSLIRAPKQKTTQRPRSD